MLDNFTNPVLILFLCISWPSSIWLTCLINERLYLDDELAVMPLVDCHALTAFMKKISFAPNVLTLMGNP